MRRWADNVLAVAVLQTQNQSAGFVLVQKSRAALAPWGQVAKTWVAYQSLAGHDLPGQRNTTLVTCSQANKGCLAPAGTAKAEIAFHHFIATDTARRIKNPERCL